MKVSFLLGAGFSYNAGLPLVKDISDKFLRQPLYDHTLWFSSGESKWTDWANEAEQHNGKIHWRGLEIAFFLEFVIKHYLNVNGLAELNYEKFYFYLLSLKTEDRETYEDLLQSAEQQYAEVFKKDDADFLSIPDYEIFSCFYHLIEDLLWVRSDREELYAAYKPYSDFFMAEDVEINIFTLNHDLLLEMLLEHYDIDYSDGFSTDGSTLVDDNGSKLKVFNGDFQKRLNLLKLHGSIDFYQYRYVRKENGHKGADYFKTLDFHTKHTANDIDESGKVIQNFTPQIIPQFITGENKLEIIQNDKMYKLLYSYFEGYLKACDKLIIVGYSFGDAHINTVLESSLLNIKEILHIDPYAVFPFKHNGYKKINPLTDQIQLLE